MPSRPSRISIFRITRRDCLLVVVGALSVLVLSFLTGSHISRTLRASNEFVPDRRLFSGDSSLHQDWEQESGTKILAHAPGWTIFRNLYMSNGTLFIVRDDPLNNEEGDFVAVDQWPLVRMMTSTGLPGYATEESIREREPTDRDMAFITPAEAASRWGENIYTVNGTSVRTHSWHLSSSSRLITIYSGCTTIHPNSSVIIIVSYVPHSSFSRLTLFQTLLLNSCWEPGQSTRTRWTPLSLQKG